MSKPKRIGIDCRFWFETGIGRYIRNIVTELAELDKENHYVLFVLKKDYDAIRLPTDFKYKKVLADVRWYTFAEQVKLPIIYYKERLDLLFVPNLNIPILYFKKFIMNMHDLTVIQMRTGRATTLPYPIYVGKRAAANFTFWYGAFFARAILTVSHFVKGEILQKFAIAKEKVYVTPCATDKKFYRRSGEEVTNTLRLYNIKQPYIFYVGNAHPHKNLERLIQAFELIHKDQPDLQLVLGGKKDFFYTRLEQEWENTDIFKFIRFTGFIDDEDLPALLSGAEALVNASLREGFGIQILEAFACGTKVVCSNTTSLPEVGGNIAYYFNPKDITNIAASVFTCLNDKSEKRIQAGLEHVKKFSWRTSAQLVLDVLNST